MNAKPQPALRIRDLSVAYPGFRLHPLSFDLMPGEALAIVGESGGGKTTLARAIAGLVEAGGEVAGLVELAGRPFSALPEGERRARRMTELAIVFQNSTTWLNPSLTLAQQLAELLRRRYGSREIPPRMAELMAQVGLEAEDLARYPRELSGGMAQRFMLASALALEPSLLILDEPTSALDPDQRGAVVALLRRLHRERGLALLLITHDLALAAELAQRVLVLYAGQLVEAGPAAALIADPRHPYTRGLVRSAVGLNVVRDLWGIRPASGEAETQARQAGCPFRLRCTQALPACADFDMALREHAPGRQIACLRGGVVRLLEARGIARAFGRRQVLGAPLRGIDLSVDSGELVAVIGRSGAGKTTLARILAGFLRPDTGYILVDGGPADLSRLQRQAGGLQYVAQDSDDALNPRLTVREAVTEPRRLARLACGEETLVGWLRAVELPGHARFLAQPIASLSGGQKQRVALARALSMRPRLLIADEPTAQLDASARANLLRLLKSLQYSEGFAMLMITHDLASAAKVADRILRLEDGQLRRIPAAALLRALQGRDVGEGLAYAERDE